MIGSGLVLFLAGVAVGATLPLCLPGYRRTARLIEPAQQLDLRFAFESQERDWVRLAQSLTHWPRSFAGGGGDILPFTRTVPYSIAGLFLGVVEGVRLALLEPSSVNSLLFPHSYTPAIYSMRMAKIFILLPDTVAVSIGESIIAPQIRENAVSQGLTIEACKGTLAFSATGNLTEVDRCKDLLDRALQLRRSIPNG